MHARGVARCTTNMRGPASSPADIWPSVQVSPRPRAWRGSASSPRQALIPPRRARRGCCPGPVRAGDLLGSPPERVWWFLDRSRRPSAILITMPAQHRHRDHLVRPRLDPDEALHDQRDQRRHLLQHAARRRRRAPSPAVHLHAVQRGRRPRAHREGLRAHQGPVRRARPTSSRRSTRWRRRPSRSRSSSPGRRSIRCTSTRATTSGPTRAASAPTSSCTTRCSRPASSAWPRTRRAASSTSSSCGRSGRA